MRIESKMVKQFVAMSLATAFFAGCGGDEKAAAPTPAAKAAVWPQQSVTLLTTAKTGTIDDLFLRAAAEVVAGELGVAVEVKEDTKAAATISGGPADGLQWAGVSDDILPAIDPADWSFFVIADAPAVVSVPANSRIAKLQNLVRESKREETEVTVAASGEGSVWHSKLIGFGSAAKTEFQFRNFLGEGPSKLAAVGGQVSAVLTSVGDQAADIQSGKLKPLGMVDGEAFELRGFGEIATASDFYPDVSDDPVSRFVAIAVPVKVPTDAKQRIADAISKAVADPKLKSLANERIWRLKGVSGPAIDRQLVAAATRRAADRAAIAEAKKKKPEDQ